MQGGRSSDFRGFAPPVEPKTAQKGPSGPIRFASVTFSVDARQFGVDPTDDQAVIELLRAKLEGQPFEWSLEQYSNEEELGTEERLV